MAARGLAHGGGAICHLQRGDDRKARPALKRMVDMAAKLGASGEDLEYLRAFIDCGGDDAEVARGKERVKAIGARQGAGGGDREDLDALRAYCEVTAKGAEGAYGAVKRLQDRARGLLDRLKKEQRGAGLIRFRRHRSL